MKCLCGVVDFLFRAFEWDELVSCAIPIKVIQAAVDFARRRHALVGILGMHFSCAVHFPDIVAILQKL